MTAGHSLGEFSALVAAGALSFEDGLKLVYARAMAMQKACEAQPSTMAAIIALSDEKVEEICEQVTAEGEVCVAANYNCPGQIVISGETEQVKQAADKLKEAGAKRAVMLNVSGPFHSPMMIPAGEALDDGEHQPQISLDQFPAGLLVPGLGAAQEFHGLLVFQHLQLCRVDARDLHLALHGSVSSGRFTVPIKRE